MCAFVKILETPPPPHLIPHLSSQALFCPRAPLVNQLFHCGSEELLEIREVEQLMDHRVCFIFPCFTFSPGSLLRPYRLSAPGWQSNLFASYASCGTSVSTSSAAKHFKLCKFNEQQSNNVPKGMAFFSFPFVSTGAVMLLSERCAPSSLAAVISHCISLYILSERLFQNLLAGCLPRFQRHFICQDIGRKIK